MTQAELLWVCADCRSVNEVGHTRCYHCGLDRTAITGPLQVFDGEGLVTLDADHPDDDLEVVPAAFGIVTPTEATALGTRPEPVPPAAPAVAPPVAAAIPPRKLVAVGPGKAPSASKVAPAALAAPSAPSDVVDDGAAPVDAPTPVAVPVSSTRKRTRGTTAGRRGSTATVDPPDPIVEA